ncbi:MAG: ATP-binding protein [Desulfuromonadaceae bacterium]
MVLNALEASAAGETVRLRLLIDEAAVTIVVINRGEIPKEVQLSIFKRSFSTKSSSGRGIGTYSMKLFGERYLGGKVGFSSEQGETRFFIRLPISGKDSLPLS